MSPILVMMVLAIPLITTAVVVAAARQEDGTAIPFRTAMPLIAATAIALAISVVIPLSFLVAIVAFVLLFALAIRVMQAIERAALAEIVESPVRTATLEPRHVVNYLPLAWRVADVVVTLACLGWVIEVARTSSPRFMLFAYSGIGITFYLLYEAWIRQEVFEVRAREEKDRRRRVRFIFVAQIILTISFLALAALSLRAEPGRVALGVAATLIGTPGCALALSTGVQRRYLEALH